MCRECGTEGWHVEPHGDDDEGLGTLSRPLRTLLGLGERLQLLARLNCDPRQGLRTFMEHLSEERYDASWHMGLEYVLWDAWHDKPSQRIRDWEASMLRVLAKQAGGWWIWDEEFDKQRFVTLEHFEEILARRLG